MVTNVEKYTLNRERDISGNVKFTVVCISSNSGHTFVEKSVNVTIFECIVFSRFRSAINMTPAKTTF